MKKKSLIKNFALISLLILSLKSVFASPFDPVFNILRSFSEGFISVLGDNPYVYTVVIYFVLILIFRQILILALSALPVFKGSGGYSLTSSNTSQEKSKRMIALLVGILMATGLLGFMGSTVTAAGYSFSAEAIRDNAIQIGMIFGKLTAWVLGICFGALVASMFVPKFKEEITSYRMMAILLSLAVTFLTVGSLNGVTQANGGGGEWAFGILFLIFGSIFGMLYVSKTSKKTPKSTNSLFGFQGNDKSEKPMSENLGYQGQSETPETSSPSPNNDEKEMEEFAKTEAHNDDKDERVAEQIAAEGKLEKKYIYNEMQISKKIIEDSLAKIQTLRSGNVDSVLAGLNELEVLLRDAIFISGKHHAMYREKVKDVKKLNRLEKRLAEKRQKVMSFVKRSKNPEYLRLFEAEVKEINSEYETLEAIQKLALGLELILKRLSDVRQGISKEEGIANLDKEFKTEESIKTYLEKVMVGLRSSKTLSPDAIQKLTVCLQALGYIERIKLDLSTHAYQYLEQIEKFDEGYEALNQRVKQIDKYWEQKVKGE